MMKPTLGGINHPRVPPAAMLPVASLGEYPNFLISGRAHVPIAAAVATEEPDTAAKPALATMVVMASPPGSILNHLSKASYIFLIIPTCSAKQPMATKSGITVNA